MPTVDINLHSVCTTAALAEAAWAAQPLDSSQGQGSRRKLVVIASMAGLSGLPVAPTYGCAKHGVVGLWLATCARLRKLGERRGFEWVQDAKSGVVIVTDEAFGRAAVMSFVLSLPVS